MTSMQVLFYLAALRLVLFLAALRLAALFVSLFIIQGGQCFPGPRAAGKRKGPEGPRAAGKRKGPRRALALVCHVRDPCELSHGILCHFLAHLS